VAVHHLSELAKFMQNMNDLLPSKVSLNWAIELQTLAERVKKASNPCLHENDVKQVWNLAQQLICANPDTTKQLALFWNFYEDLKKILISNPKAVGYAPQWKLDKLRDKIKNADSLAERLVSEGMKKPSFVFSTALLLAHVIRTESIEYPILYQLDKTIKKYKSLQKYDSVLMCSVKYKVVKYDEKLEHDVWKSDVRAIRDAIAHAHFSITNNGTDDLIEFDNNEKGYHFTESFTLKEFHHFFDTHTVLYKFQMLLLYIIELLPVLTTHLLKKPSKN
jgi:hypothetical protein